MIPEIDRIRTLLTAAGCAWTRPRAQVLAVLTAVAHPLRVEEIHRRLGDPRINLSSVYRALHLFHRLNVVRRLQLGDGAARYELAEAYRGHHHHLVCDACGRIEDVSRCPLEGRDLGAALGAAAAFAVRSHSLELFGLCGSCARGDGGGGVAAGRP